MPNSHITQFEAIFKYASEGILTTDMNGRIRSVNPAACKLFLCKEAELINQKVERLIPKRYSKHDEYRSKFVQNPHARTMGSGLDLYGLKKDGTEFPLEISLSPYESEGEVFVIAFIIDISLRKEVENKEKNYREELEREVGDRTLILKEAIQKLETTKRNLDQALKREMEANSIKSRFVSIASHEFRTPLSTMLSSLVLIEKYKERGDDEKEKKHIERIKKSIRSLTEILNDILSINKLEEGKIIPQKSTLQLKMFLEALINEISLIARPGQKIQLLDFEDVEMEQDATLMSHILTNLLSNAIKFSPNDSLIKINVKPNGDKVEFTISDQGIGIPEANMSQLFTRFYRADNAGQIQGTGLGLSIVKQYCELLNGSVSVKSVEQEGTSFTVTLPVKFE